MTILSQSIREQCERMENIIREGWSWPSPDTGFVAHVLRRSGKPLPSGVRRLDFGEPERHRLTQAPVLSAFGYLFSPQDADLAQSLAPAWSEGLTRLSAREPFPLDRESFVFRPIELLGVSLGAFYCAAVTVESKQWLTTVLLEAEAKLQGSGLWSYLLGAWAARFAGIEWKPIALPRLEDLSDVELSLIRWICREHIDVAISQRFEEKEAELGRLVAARYASRNLGESSGPQAALHLVSMEQVAGSSAVESSRRSEQRERRSVPDDPHPLSPYVVEEQPWFTPLPGEREKDEGSIGNVKIDVVLLTAVQVELRAVLRQLRPLPGEKTVWRIVRRKETYYIGRFGGHIAAVTMCRMGYSEQGASLAATSKAIEAWRPKAVIMVGIAFGKDPTKQRIADVLVSSQVICYGVQRVGIGQEIIYRGAIAPCGAALLNRFRNALRWSFKRPDGSESQVKDGPVLSAEVLVDDPDYKRKLFEAFPQAIGGEMEGAGVYSASEEWNTEWIIVKGICDWADGAKGETHQALAAAAAVSLVTEVLSNKLALSDLGS